MHGFYAIFIFSKSAEMCVPIKRLGVFGHVSRVRNEIQLSVRYIFSNINTLLGIMMINGSLINEVGLKEQ